MLDGGLEVTLRQLANEFHAGMPEQGQILSEQCSVQPAGRCQIRQHWLSEGVRHTALTRMFVHVTNLISLFQSKAHASVGFDKSSVS